MAWKVALFLTLNLALSACSRTKETAQPRQFSGVWLYEFEGSTFVEDATEIPKERIDYSQAAWLNYNPEQIFPQPDYDDYSEAHNCYPVHPFAVTFVGRKRTNPGGSGHMGLWSSEIVVDRMIEAKPLGPPFCYVR